MSRLERITDEFERSLARCLGGGDFFGAFYERFLSSSDQVRLKFSGTDFGKQKLVLQRSLYLMARSSLGIDEGLDHLEAIARSHSRRHLDIPPSLYELWLESLVLTAKEFDPEFSLDVERVWLGALRPGIDRMVEVYRSEATLRPDSAKN